MEAVQQLVLICNDQMIAGFLNRNGLLTGTGNRWTKAPRVASLRSHHRIPPYKPESRTVDGWMTLTEAAEVIGTSSTTLRIAVECGEIQALHPLADGPWIFRRIDLAQAQQVRWDDAGGNESRWTEHIVATFCSGGPLRT